jgi:predicted transcriptional regulator
VANKITDFGYNFQIKLIVSLMTESKFVEQIHDILDEKHFDNEAIRWVVRECKKYYLKYKKSPTLNVFKMSVGEIKNDILKTTVVDTLKQVYQNIESPELEFIQDKALDFFKNQALKSAIVQSVDILEGSGDFEKIKVLIDEAMKAGTERDVGHDYIEDVEHRYSEMARTTVETPWDVINDLMQGGLGKGELGVIVAPAGIGKSWVLSSLGSGALKKGMNVIHYTLELNEAYVGLRYDSVFTGIANQNLKYHKDDVIKKIEDLPGNLTIKYFPTKSASVHTISAHIQRMKTLGHKIDMVVVDYADIMRDVGNAKEVRHALGNIYEDLRGMAGEFEIPIWTASQANRSALDEDFIDASKIAESYQKVMTADFVMSLSRKVEDKIGNTGRFHVMKNRFGPDGLTYPAKVNTNIGDIKIYEGDTVDGKQQQHKINNRDNIARKMLKNSYEDLMNEDT